MVPCTSSNGVNPIISCANDPMFMFLILCLACTAERDWPINEVILSGPQDLWDFQGDLSLSLARHHSIATVVDWSQGRVVAQCALGPDLLDVRLSPDGKHIAWLDRKSLHVVQSDSCESRTHAWSQLWPSAPPAPVQVQWADSEHLVSHTTPPLRVPISQPEQSRPLGQSRMVPIGMHSVGSMHLCGDSRGLVFDCDSGAVHFELSSRISSVSFFQGEVCALSAESLRCGSTTWNVSAMDFHYPELIATKAGLWVLDEPSVGTLMGARWF